MDEKNLLKLFNDRVKDVAKELNISDNEAFIKVLAITYESLNIFNYVYSITKKEK